MDGPQQHVFKEPLAVSWRVRPQPKIELNIIVNALFLLTSPELGLVFLLA
jgi:hypothetical protein